ncbi:MAG: hypothetical protein Q7R76_00990 [Candidatus Woesearchaeota archaeon]|nr:hypothetical protein [Candidatus Woesearchaeota archaeon]
MVCYSGLKPYERQGMEELAKERHAAGLPLHLVVPEHMKAGTAPMLRSIDALAERAEPVPRHSQTVVQPTQLIYEGRGTETTPERTPYFS